MLSLQNSENHCLSLEILRTVKMERLDLGLLRLARGFCCQQKKICNLIFAMKRWLSSPFGSDSFNYIRLQKLPYRRQWVISTNIYYRLACVPFLYCLLLQNTVGKWFRWRHHFMNAVCWFLLIITLLGPLTEGNGKLGRKSKRKAAWV